MICHEHTPRDIALSIALSVSMDSLYIRPCAETWLIQCVIMLPIHVALLKEFQYPIIDSLSLPNVFLPK